jgi:hypothetical protein
MGWLTIHGLKAVLILAMIFVNWAALIVLFALLHIFAIINQSITGVRSSYWLFIAEDHLVNAIMSGHFETTISSEIGFMHKNGSRTGAKVASVVNWIFWTTTKDPKQKNHCIISIQPADIFAFSAIRAIIGTILFQFTNSLIAYAIFNTYF